MNIIVCLDENQGMLFNQRRQSRDKAVIENMLQMVEEAGGRLWIHPYSEKLFGGSMQSVCCEEDFLQKAAEEDWCFVEKQALKECEEEVRSVTVYWWNRRYPSDQKLDLDLKHWKSQCKCDFAGFSHETITREVYVR